MFQTHLSKICAELWTFLTYEHNFFLLQSHCLLTTPPFFSTRSYNVSFSFQYAASHYFFHLNSTHITFVQRKKKKTVTHLKNHFLNLFSVIVPYPIPLHLAEVLRGCLLSLCHSFLTIDPKWIVVFLVYFCMGQLFLMWYLINTTPALFYICSLNKCLSYNHNL